MKFKLEFVNKERNKGTIAEFDFVIDCPLSNVIDIINNFIDNLDFEVEKISLKGGKVK